MADWRTNEKYRKPRRAKGTPFYVQRNYYAFGVLVGAALLWEVYELWPGAKKLRKAQADGKFDIPEGLEIKKKHIQAGFSNPPMNELLAKAREREAQKYEDQSKPQSWLSKALSSNPDV